MANRFQLCLVMCKRPGLDILTSRNIRTMMSTMRTTLTIDGDIADYLREQSRLHEKSFKQVVNETLRRGMMPYVNSKARKPYKVRTFSSPYAPGIDRLRLNQLNDELEVEDFLKERAR